MNLSLGTKKKKTPSVRVTEDDVIDDQVRRRRLSWWLHTWLSIDSSGIWTNTLAKTNNSRKRSHCTRPRKQSAPAECSTWARCSRARLIYNIYRNVIVFADDLKRWLCRRGSLLFISLTEVWVCSLKLLISIQRPQWSLNGWLRLRWIKKDLSISTVSRSAFNDWEQLPKRPRHTKIN